MKIFLDTSSLVKLYHKEDGSEQLIDLALDAQEIYLSSLAKLELSSALWRKVRTKQISKEDCKTVIAIFEEDYCNYRWILHDEHINQSAYNLLMKWGESGLRTLDSIQLASAITLREMPSTIFCTADNKLNEIFEKEHLFMNDSCYK